MEKYRKILDCGKNHYNVIDDVNFCLKGFDIMAKEFKITSLRLQDLEKERNDLKTTPQRFSRVKRCGISFGRHFLRFFSKNEKTS